MRTTIDIEPNVLGAATVLAREEKVDVGKVISRLVRKALMARIENPSPTDGTRFESIPARGVVVTNSLVDRLRDLVDV